MAAAAAREDYAEAAALKQELAALGPADAAEQDSSATATGEERPSGSFRKGGKGGGGANGGGKPVRAMSMSNVANVAGKGEVLRSHSPGRLTTSPVSSPAKGGEASPAPAQHAHAHLHHHKHNFAKR